jgi:hypothetical protein
MGKDVILSNHKGKIKHVNDVIYILNVTKKMFLLGVITNRRCLVIFEQNCC